MIPFLLFFWLFLEPIYSYLQPSHSSFFLECVKIKELMNLKHFLYYKRGCMNINPL